MTDPIFLPALDTSTLGDDRLARRVARALLEATGGTEEALLRRSGGLEAEGWLRSAPRAEPPPAPTLLVTTLATLDRAMAPSDSLRWIGAVRARRPWIAAFVQTAEDRAVAHRTEALLRTLDGRLTLLPSPQRGGRSRLVHWLLDLASLLRPQAILEAHLEAPAPMTAGMTAGMTAETAAGTTTGPTAPSELVVRFGDDRTGRAPLPHLGLGPDDGLPRVRVVAPGAGGRSLQVSDGGGRMVLAFEAAEIRARMEATWRTAAAAPTPALAPDPTDPQSSSPASPSDGPRPPTLGARLRGVRLARELTQAGLAERAGLHQSMVSNLERDLHSPRVDTILGLARALRVPAASLLEGIRLPDPEAPPASSPD